MQEAGYNAEKSMPGANKASLGQNDYNMSKQKIDIGVGNQGNYNQGMRNNYNNN